MTSVRILRQGNLAEMTILSGTISDNLKKELEAQLSYNHVSQVRGGEAYKTGSYVPFITEHIELYAYDASGRLVFPKGFVPRVKKLCEKEGCHVTVLTLHPEFHDPSVYVPDFTRLFARMDLRARQDECVAAITASDGGNIVAPTGFGKSAIICGLALAFNKAKIHVVTRRKDVVGRLVRSLSKLLPDVGQVGGGRREWSRVTVITADSLHLVDHGPGQEPHFLFFDEVHEAAAPTYALELGKYKHTRMYGFSASLESRFDGAHHRLEGLFGPKIFEMSYPEAVALELVLPVKVEWIDVRMNNPCEFKRETAKERAGIWRNETRNKLIAEKARSFDPEDQVLILVRTLEHAMFLKRELPEFRLCYDKMDSEVYNGLVSKGVIDGATEPAMTSAIRDNMSKQFEAGTLKKVIATDVWSTGVDFPQLSVLIRADARSSEIMDIQAPGRVVRRHDESGKSYGLLVDCRDWFDGSFMGRSRSREKTYIKQGWEPTKKRSRVTNANRP
jgi:superfamily II DNA or RNA helicase